LSLVLFDIDGTLLLSGGAGVRAMTAAFADVFGVANAFEGIPIAGFTDTFLLSRALAKAGLPDTPDVHRSFRDAYLALLSDQMQLPGSGRKGVMPGVPELLTALPHAGCHLALLTGNYERAANIKLEYFGLAQHFAWGAFGEEAADRNELARLALGKARQRDVPAHACQRAVVIGDTPHDIACAHAAGARALGVATGNFSIDELRAAGADVAVADLSDTADVLRILKQI
jgi:phosphoglycolate phosphatase-like HAD superfamily hydrolase